MAKQTKAKTSHQVGNVVKKRGKNGKVGTITAVVGKAQYLVKWAGEDTASDKVHANTSLMAVAPPAAAAAGAAVEAAVEAGAEVNSDAGSDDDGDQFEAAREEDGHEQNRAAFELHARSLDGETQAVTVSARNHNYPRRCT